MKIQITLANMKKFPDRAILALKRELIRRINHNYSYCRLQNHGLSSCGLSILVEPKGDKQRDLKRFCRWSGKMRITNHFRILPFVLPSATASC